MFRRGRSCFGGGLCWYIKDSIASKKLNSHKENMDVEAIYLEINMRKRKWLIIGTYKPSSQSDSLFLENLSNNLFTYLKDYDNMILLGDFNMTPKNTNLTHFIDSFNLENWLQEAKCFKVLLSCIDLIITNRKSYKYLWILEPYKYLCDSNRYVRFSQINSSQFKISSTGSSFLAKFHRSYKNFDEVNLNKDLKLKLDSLEELDYSLFENTFIDVLNTPLTVL